MHYRQILCRHLKDVVQVSSQLSSHQMGTSWPLHLKTIQCACGIWRQEQPFGLLWKAIVHGSTQLFSHQMGVSGPLHLLTRQCACRIWTHAQPLGLLWKAIVHQSAQLSSHQMGSSWPPNLLTKEYACGMLIWVFSLRPQNTVASKGAVFFILFQLLLLIWSH